MLLDLDAESGHLQESHRRDVERFLDKTNEYFYDHDFNEPVRAFTGRGFHLLLAYPGIRVAECSDIGERLREFRNRFHKGYEQELERLELRLDHTEDLVRRAKIYGTAKPEVGIVSRFYGNERIEDETLRGYLLSLEIHDTGRKPGFELATGTELPNWFTRLLETDNQLRQLWTGSGKPGNTDRSRTGFDYSLIRRLLYLGHQDIGELATILGLRPDGAVQASRKGSDYVRRTIGNALIR